MNTIYKGTIGIGLLIGLMIGTFLYVIGNYTVPFIVYSICMVCITPLAVKFIPSKTQDTSKDAADKGFRNLENSDLESGDDHTTKDGETVGYQITKKENNKKPTYDVTTPFKIVCTLLSNPIILK